MPSHLPPVLIVEVETHKGPMVPYAPPVWTLAQAGAYIEQARKDGYKRGRVVDQRGRVVWTWPEGDEVPDRAEPFEDCPSCGGTVAEDDGTCLECDRVVWPWRRA